MPSISANEKRDDSKNPLWEDILKFRKNKLIIAVVLVLIGLTGIVVPIVPGLLLFIIAIALFKKGWMQKIRARLNRKKKNSPHDENNIT